MNTAQRAGGALKILVLVKGTIPPSLSRCNCYDPRSPGLAPKGDLADPRAAALARVTLKVTMRRIYLFQAPNRVQAA